MAKPLSMSTDEDIAFEKLMDACKWRYSLDWLGEMHFAYFQLCYSGYLIANFLLDYNSIYPASIFFYKIKEITALNNMSDKKITKKIIAYCKKKYGYFVTDFSPH